MTSKELNEILNKTRRTQNISLTTKQVEELVKDLEVLEILKNNLYVNTEYTEENDYEISIKELWEDEKYKIKEWLDGYY